MCLPSNEPLRGARYVDDIAIRIGAHKGTTAVEEGNLVLLEQVLHTVVVLLDDGILVQHLGRVHRDVDAEMPWSAKW